MNLSPVGERTAGATVRVHRFLAGTRAEGPGDRAALWVQGCPIRCPGCFNSEAWDIDGGTLESVAELLTAIRAQQGIEGVTFVGGEPFSQAEALAELGRCCRDVGLSVVTFTGYEYTHLCQASRPDWKALLAVTDLLLAGPFIRSQQDYSRPWVGSRNQEFVFLTDRYRPLAHQLQTIPNRLELRFDADGALAMNGLAPESEIEAMRGELAAFGLRLTRA